MLFLCYFHHANSWTPCKLPLFPAKRWCPCLTSCSIYKILVVFYGGRGSREWLRECWVHEEPRILKMHTKIYFRMAGCLQRQTVFTYSLLFPPSLTCVSSIVCMLLTEMRKFGDLGVLQESPGVCCVIRMSSYCRAFPEPCMERTTYNTKKDAWGHVWFSW
jgi:hypothetical protein